MHHTCNFRTKRRTSRFRQGTAWSYLLIFTHLLFFLFLLPPRKRFRCLFTEIKRGEETEQNSLLFPQSVMYCWDLINCLYITRRSTVCVNKTESEWEYSHSLYTTAFKLFIIIFLVKEINLQVNINHIFEYCTNFLSKIPLISGYWLIDASLNLFWFLCSKNNTFNTSFVYFLTHCSRRF